MLATLPESIVEISQIGLKFHGVLTYEQISQALLSAWDLTQFSKWAQIDLLVLGHDMLGEDFPSLVDGYHYSPRTVSNMLWIGRNVPIHARVEGVSIGHHEVVAPAKFSIEEKVAWLLKAKEERWSREDFRLAVNGLLESGEYQVIYKPISYDSALYLVIDWIDGKTQYTQEELKQILLEVLSDHRRVSTQTQ